MLDGSCFLAVWGAHFGLQRRAVVPTGPVSRVQLMTKARRMLRTGSASIVPTVRDCRWWPAGPLYDMLKLSKCEGALLSPYVDCNVVLLLRPQLSRNKPTSHTPSASPSKTSAAHPHAGTCRPSWDGAVHRGAYITPDRYPIGPNEIASTVGIKEQYVL